MKNVMGFLKKEKLLVIALMISAVIFSAGYFTQKEEVLEGVKFTHIVTIEDLGSYEVFLKGGQTAGEALDIAANKNNFSVEYQEFDFGRMIFKIGEKSADNQYFWALYINNKMAEVGADSLILEEGDKTEWKYKKIEL